MRSWQSILPFAVVMMTIVGLVHYYLYARIVKAADLAPPTARAFGIVFVLLAVFTATGSLLSRFLSRDIGSVVGFVAFTWLGLLILLLFLTLSAELLRLVVAGLGKAGVFEHDAERRTFLSRVISAGITGGAAALGIYGFSVARGRVGVEKVQVALKRWPAAMSGFRIAQLTDVHIGPTLGKEWLAEVVKTVNAENPDLVVITGDLVDGSVKELADHVAPLKDLRAKHGVYFVTGNHEYYSGVDEWTAHLPSLGVEVLRNRRVNIGEGEESFELAGVDDWRGKPDLKGALEGRDQAKALVLLAHQPKQAPDAAALGVGLQLSGHTHGGQIFPWNYFVRLDQPFIAGLDRIGEFQIYTSRGTGYWGPPMRVGAPPEIALIELRPA